MPAHIGKQSFYFSGRKTSLSRRSKPVRPDAGHSVFTPVTGAKQTFTYRMLSDIGGETALACRRVSWLMATDDGTRQTQIVFAIARRCKEPTATPAGHPAMAAKKSEAIEIVCPRCNRTAIVYIPEQQIPRCPDCNIQMVIRELMKEGKSY
jgi:ribosomal protein S27E